MAKAKTVAHLALSSVTGSTATVSTNGTRAGWRASIATWTLTWGDGTVTTGSGVPTPSSRAHSYGFVGTYLITLTVHDSKGVSAQDSHSVSIGTATHYTLTVTNGSGDGSYAVGQSVPIVADPPAIGFVFSQWSGGVVTNQTSGVTTVIMPASNLTLTATYVVTPDPPPPTPPNYLLQVNNGSGSGTYASSTVVPIVAFTAPAGQAFSAWTGATVASSTSASTTLTMPAANASVTATYAALPPTPGVFNLTVEHGTGSGAYAAGATVPISADAAPDGEVFSLWAGGTVQSPSLASTSVIMPASDLTVTATYKNLSKQLLLPADYTYRGSAQTPQITLPTGRFGFAHGPMTGRHIGGEIHLLVLGYIGASGTEELIECKWNGVGMAHPMTFVKNWGDPTQGKMVTEGSAPRVQSLLWDDTLNAVVWSYGGTYNVSGTHIPSIGYSILNDGAGTLTAYGPWKTVTHSKKTEGYLVPLPNTIQGLLSGGKRFGVGAMQSSGNALSPWGAFLTAFALPSTSTPPDTVNDPHCAIDDQPLIYSDIDNRQIKNGDTVLCGWTHYGEQDSGGAEPQANPTQNGSGCTVNGQLCGVVSAPTAVPGVFDGLDAMMSVIWINGPNKQGLTYFAELLKTIPGFNYGGVDPSHAHHWYGPTQVYPTGKFCPHGHNGAWTGPSTGDASDRMGNFLYVYDPADIAAVIAGTRTPLSITQNYAAIDAYLMASIAHAGSVQIDGVNHVDVPGAPFPPLANSAGTDASSRGVWWDPVDQNVYLIEILIDHVFSEIQPVVHLFAVNC